MLSCLQQRIRKRRVYVPVLIANWLVFTLMDLIMAGLYFDIVDGVCVPYANSPVMEQAMAYYVLFIYYVLPLTLMILCYSRIAYRLRAKVTKHHTKH